MADAQLDAVLAQGQEAIDSMIGQAARLADVLAANFPAVTLEQVAAEFAKAPVSKEANAKVAKLSALLREEAALAASTLRSAEMWIHLKSPAVSDGNNFGVDVQNYILGEVKALRTATEAMTTSGKDYHWARAQGLDKVVAEEKATVEKSSNAEAEAKDGEPEKKTTKTTTNEKTTTSTPSVCADYKEYVVSVDVRQYHAVFLQLTDLRHSYLRAHLLFSKNLKRLADPRGEGSGSNTNVMSMF